MIIKGALIKYEKIHHNEPVKVVGTRIGPNSCHICLKTAKKYPSNYNALSRSANNVKNNAFDSKRFQKSVIFDIFWAFLAVFGGFSGYSGTSEPPKMTRKLPLFLKIGQKGVSEIFTDVFHYSEHK